MSRMSWREYLTRLAWLEFVDRNRPGKTEEYLMQVALRVIQFAGFGGSADRASLPLSSQRLEWVEPEVQPAYSKRELADRASAAMRSTLIGAASGGKVQVKQVDGPRAPLPPSQRVETSSEDDENG